MTPIYIPGPSKPEMKAYTDEVLAALLELPWLEVTPARKEFFMSDRPRSYAYKTYDGMRDYHSNPFTHKVEAIRLTNNLLGIGQVPRRAAEYNVCFLNRYDDQRNHLGWHADDSPEMDHDHPIAVVSLGAEREFWWKPKSHKGEIPPEWRQKLAHGSVFVMPAGFQRDYLHRIPKCDHAVGVRVSLTFRRYIDKEPARDDGLPSAAAG